MINRRGSASVVMCRDCGYVQACPECERPLVYPRRPAMTLRCHHCGTAAPLASRCPACGSPRIRYLGGGTERVEREVRERFPGLRVGRLDRDVVERKGAAERVVDAFTDGRLDVLVGTSLVTKGLDIPEVTLVGVVSAPMSPSTCPTSAPPSGRTSCSPRPSAGPAAATAGPGDHPDLPARPSGDPGGRSSGDPPAFYDAELEAPPAVRVAAVRPARQADRRRSPTRPRRSARPRGDGRPAAGAGRSSAGSHVDGHRPGAGVHPPPGRPLALERRPARRDPGALLDGGLEAPWSVDVDPESLL